MPIINNIMIFVHRFAHKKLKKRYSSYFGSKVAYDPGNVTIYTCSYLNE